MRPYKVKIPAGEAVQLIAPGDYVRVKSASVALLVESRELGEMATLEAGDSVSLSPFTRLELSHEGAAEQEVAVYVGKGTRMQSSQVGGSISISGPVSVDGYKNNSAFVHSTVSLVGASMLAFAANPARKFLSMQNNDPAVTAWVRMDGAAAIVGVGFRLAPGESLVLDVCVPTAAVYVTSSAAGTVAMGLTEG